LGSDAEWRFVHGAVQTFADGATGRVKVLDHQGRLLGVGTLADGELRPDKVLPPDAYL
jgi:hypothetical protein